MKPNEGQRCYNKNCNTLLTEEDFGKVCGMEINFESYHVCRTCWRNFDGQKMRGRFAMIPGFTKTMMVDTQRQLDQLSAPGAPPFDFNFQDEEDRYTESMDEWISWQASKEVES